MTRTWKYFIFAGITLFIIEVLLVISLYFFNYINSLKETLIIFSINILLFFFVFFVFLLDIKRKIRDSEQVISQIDKTAFRFSGLGIVIFNYSKEIIWTNELIEERGDKNLIGKSIFEWIPDLSKLLINQNLKLKINLNERVYEVRLLKETSTILLHDITQYEVLLKNHLNDNLIMGILFIGNLSQILSTENERVHIKLSSIINEEISSWSEKYNLFIKSIDKDHYMIIGKYYEYEKIVKEDKFSLIQSISKKTNSNIAISIGVAYGINDANLLYDLALKNLNKAISKGGNQAISQSYLDKNLHIYGWDNETIEQITSLESKLFGSKLKEKISNSSNVLISGHKWGDYDSIGSSLALYYLAKYLNKDAKIVINFDLLDNNAKTNLDNIIPPAEMKNIYIKPSQVHKYFNSETLMIVADTHIKQRTEFAEFLDQTKNIIVLDHHLLSDGDTITKNDSYIQHNASSTSEIVMEIITKFLTQKDIPEFAINLLFAGILLDTNNFKVRTSQRTFETVAILKSWGAKPQVAQSIMKDDLDNILLKQSIISNSFQFAPGYICACANENIRIPRSIVAQVAQDMSEIKGIKAAFAIAYDDQGVSNISARSNNIVNVQAIIKELGGGGHYNAAAAQQPNSTITQVLKSLIKIVLRRINTENQQEKMLLKKEKEDKKNTKKAKKGNTK